MPSNRSERECDRQAANWVDEINVRTAAGAFWQLNEKLVANIDQQEVPKTKTLS